MSKNSDAQWAKVEIMGHVTVVGVISETEKFGGMLRVDVPTVGDGFATRLFGYKSIHSITPLSEEIAREMSRVNKSRPVTQWELRDFGFEAGEILELPEPEISEADLNGGSQNTGDDMPF